jgi:hypothetical protein
MKNEEALPRVGPQRHKKKFNVEVGQKTVHERGINGVCGDDRLQLAEDRLQLLYF